MNERYADIIVDITHEKLDRTFQYQIPPELEGRVQAGTRVKIPFGGGNRIIDGYEYLGDQTLIVFSVGLSSVNDDIIRDIKRRNLPDFLQENVFFKALPGGLARKDTLPGATMAHKVDFYREKRAEGKTLTRGDMIALAIADGESPDQNRYDEGEASVIVNAARRHV